MKCDVYKRKKKNYNKMKETDEKKNAFTKSKLTSALIKLSLLVN